MADSLNSFFMPAAQQKHQQQAGGKGRNSPLAFWYFEHVMNKDYAGSLRYNKHNCHQHLSHQKVHGVNS